MRQDWPVKHALQWQRTKRLRLRPLARADLQALQWLAGAGGDAAERWPGVSTAGQLMARAPGLQVAVEVDQQLVGALLAELRAPPAAVAHPWSRRPPSTCPADDDSPDAHTPFSQVLHGRGVLLTAPLPSPQIVHIFQLARLAAARQFGCVGAVSQVTASAWQDWRAHLSPEAFLQQLHAGGISDPGITHYMRAGYLIRGFSIERDDLQVVLQWANRAH